MAILGFHIVLTLISASILQKLSGRFSFGRRLLSKGLRRWMPPHVEELREALGVVPVKSKKKKNHSKDETRGNPDSFWVPKALTVEIYDTPIHSYDVLQLPCYVDFRWLIDFTVATCIVYIISECYLYLTYGAYTNEINLSIIWCFITLGVALKSLASMTALYFQNAEKDTGERSLVLCIGAIYFLVSFAFLLGVERIFDVKLHGAYENFTASANEYLKEQDMEVKRSSQTSVLLYVFFSVLFGFIAGMLVFPSFRYSKMYADSLRWAEGKPFTKLILHLNFFAPIVTLILWLRPFSSALLARDPAIVTASQIDGLRLWSIIWMVLLRLLAFRSSIQAYLNVAQDKVLRLRSEAGRIKSDEMQNMISRIYMFLCVAASQYMVPVVLLFAINCLLKTLGNYSWVTPFGFPDFRLPILASLVAKEPAMFSSASTDLRQSLMTISELFNVAVNRGVWSFILVMVTTINVSLNLLGVVYNIRFENSH